MRAVKGDDSLRAIFYIHKKMKNKHFYTVFLLVSSFVIGIFFVPVEAVYRGTTRIEFSQFKQNNSRNISKGYRGLRLKKTTENKGITFSDLVFNRSSRSTTGLRKSFSRKNFSSSIKTVATQSFFADNVESFVIELPQSFKKGVDTLTTTEGKIVFSDENSTISVTALGNICEGGSVFVQDCLNKKSDIRTNSLQKEWPSGVIVTKEVTKLRSTDDFRFDQANAGKWFILDIGNKKLGILTFFDPKMKYVWQIEIESLDTSSGFLNNAQLINKMKESLFVPEKKEGPSLRIIKRAQESRASRLRSRLRGRKK